MQNLPSAWNAWQVETPSAHIYIRWSSLAPSQLFQQRKYRALATRYHTCHIYPRRYLHIHMFYSLSSFLVFLHLHNKVFHLLISSADNKNTTQRLSKTMQSINLHHYIWTWSAICRLNKSFMWYRNSIENAECCVQTLDYLFKHEESYPLGPAVYVVSSSWLLEGFREPYRPRTILLDDPDALW